MRLWIRLNFAEWAGSCGWTKITQYSLWGIMCALTNRFYKALVNELVMQKYSRTWIILVKFLVSKNSETSNPRRKLEKSGRKDGDRDRERGQGEKQTEADRKKTYIMHKF